MVTLLITTGVDRAVLPARRHRADLLDDVHALDHFAEDRVAVVEMRRRPERDEELAAVGVRARRWPSTGCPPSMWRSVGMELVGEVVARPAGALAEPIAALDHEAVDHAVEDDAVVERRLPPLAGRRVAPLLGALGEADEVGDRVGGFLVEQADVEVAFRRLEFRETSLTAATCYPPTE